MSDDISTSEDGEHPTFCRLCEAYCGIVATVSNGRVAGIRPDKENPHSLGHVCVKGMAIADVAYDPDRILTPLKRVGGPGVFAPVSWDEALDDIATRLAAIIQAKGGEAVALYHGNPLGFATDFVLGTSSFLDALGAHKRYHAGSQDHSARLAANYFAFGDAERNSFPDLVYCDLLLILGANPLVSNGSMVYSPRIRHDLDAIAARGRVIVADPRRSETAQRYEHLPIDPNGDLWLLLGMLRVLIDEDLIDRQVIEDRTVGWASLEAEALKLDLPTAAQRCGIPEEDIRSLAIAFGTTERAAIYGRLGVCRGPYATLVNFLVTALNVVAGKFGRRGGTIFGYTCLAGTERGNLRHFETGRSRIGDVPAVGGAMPCAMLPADLLEEGQGRIRAMFVFGANPVLSAPGGKTLEEGLEGLELMVSCDFYLNETHRYAHYLLPSTTFLERDDVPLYSLLSLMRPFIQHTDAIIEPCGEARNDFDIMAEIARRLGKDIAPDGRPLSAIDAQLRNGPAGDGFGSRDGWSFDRLREHRHGVMVDLPDPTEAWEEKIGFPDRKFRLWDPLLGQQLEEALVDARKPPPRLRLISRRDIRSMNSWMHNIDRLSRSQSPELLMHPQDATERNIDEGDLVRLWTRFGEVHVPAALTTDIVRGAVCYPHGWGHQGGWRIANAKKGENINVLLGTGADVVELLAGMTLIDGLEVFAERSRRNVS